MAVIIIGPNTVINSNTVYNGDTLDLNNGNFVIQNNAVLSIINCDVIGTISDTNPVLIKIDLGKLIMTNCDSHINAMSVAQHPLTQSLHYYCTIESGEVDLIDNQYYVDNPFAVGFLVTSVSQTTNSLRFIRNRWEDWHGVLYLLNSNDCLIDDNIFKLCSYGNIVIIGSNNNIIDNDILLSGRDQLGNAIDVLGSDHCSITDNNIVTATCRGIFLVSSSHCMISENIITGGITYGIRIVSTTMPLEADDYAIHMCHKRNIALSETHDINVSRNVMTQNRYGLSAVDVDELNVEGNYFSQRFEDAAQRKFWTDNSVLLTGVTGLTWNNNWYKEAFTQVNGGDNSNTMIVPFPATGGVVI